MFNFRVDFSANFHVIHDFFWKGLFSLSKTWKAKKTETNINLRGCTTKKREGGVCHGQNWTQKIHFL